MAESTGAAERLILVHGATSGPWVFDHWPAAFPGYDVRAPDLQAGGLTPSGGHAESRLSLEEAR